MVRQQHKLKAIAFITLAVGLATSQDAIVKFLSGTFPAYEIMAFRGLMAIPFLSAWQARGVGFKAMNTPLLGLVMIRSLILRCRARRRPVGADWNNLMQDWKETERQLRSLSIAASERSALSR